MVFFLFRLQAPKTVENFRALATGERGMNEKGIKLHYRNTTFHRVVHGLLVFGGDIMSTSLPPTHSSGISIKMLPFLNLGLCLQEALVRKVKLPQSTVARSRLSGGTISSIRYEHYRPLSTDSQASVCFTYFLKFRAKDWFLYQT